MKKVKKKLGIKKMANKKSNSRSNKINKRIKDVKEIETVDSALLPTGEKPLSTDPLLWTTAERKRIKEMIKTTNER